LLQVVDALGPPRRLAGGLHSRKQEGDQDRDDRDDDQQLDQRETTPRVPPSHKAPRFLRVQGPDRSAMRVTRVNASQGPRTDSKTEISPIRLGGPDPVGNRVGGRQGGKRPGSGDLRELINTAAPPKNLDPTYQSYFVNIIISSMVIRGPNRVIRESKL